jgi:hypothetical protein
MLNRNQFSRPKNPEDGPARTKSKEGSIPFGDTAESLFSLSSSLVWFNRMKRASGGRQWVGEGFWYSGSVVLSEGKTCTSRVSNRLFSVKLSRWWCRPPALERLCNLALAAHNSAALLHPIQPMSAAGGQQLNARLIACKHHWTVL